MSDRFPPGAFFGPHSSDRGASETESEPLEETTLEDLLLERSVEIWKDDSGENFSLPPEQPLRF